jgi:hypothetical protein
MSEKNNYWMKIEIFLFLVLGGSGCKVGMGELAQLGTLYEHSVCVCLSAIKKKVTMT